MAFESGKEHRITLKGSAGDIEARLAMPDSNDVSAVALVCHPHPLFGGNLDNKVAYTLARSLVRMGIPALRFNFRGVGASAGKHDEGNGETEDAVMLLDWLLGEWSEAKLWMAGFSFGGMVAIRAAALRPVVQLITVAPATRYLPEDISLPDCRWLNLHGDADDVVAKAEVDKWFEDHAVQVETVTFPDSGHFFHGRLSDLRDAIEDRLGTEA